MDDDASAVYQSPSRCYFTKIDNHSIRHLLLYIIMALVIAILMRQLFAPHYICKHDQAQPSIDKPSSDDQPFCQIQPQMPLIENRNTEIVHSEDSKVLARSRAHLEYNTITAEDHQIGYLDLKLEAVSLDQDRLELKMNCAQIVFELSNEFSAHRSVQKIIVFLSRPHVGVQTCIIDAPDIVLKKGEAHYMCKKTRAYQCHGFRETRTHHIATLVMEELEFQLDGVRAGDIDFGEHMLAVQECS